MTAKITSFALKVFVAIFTIVNVDECAFISVLL